MDILDVLPPELCLHALSHLLLADLVVLCMLSRRWQNFIEENSDAVYRNAAFQHGLVEDPTTLLADVCVPHMQGANATLSSWKQLCRTQIELARGWLGTGVSRASVAGASIACVHRIKVDEAEGIAILSFSIGGLAVVDLRDRYRLIWSIPPELGYEYAHVDYDAGFVIFNRLNGTTEVWRRPADWVAADVPRGPSAPDERQEYTAAHAMHWPLPDGTPPADAQRGVFRPWAVLRPPARARCSRFVHPTLVFAGPNAAYLYDVPSAQLVKTISPTRAPGENVRAGVNYVDISATHVFVLYDTELVVLSRARGECVLRIPLADVARGPPLFTTTRAPATAEARVRANGPRVLVPEALMPSLSRHQLTQQEFHAAHVSECGRHLAILLSDNRVVLVQGWARLCKGKKLREIATSIVLGTFQADASVYLAYTGGRVGVISSAGIFVITLEPAAHGLRPAPVPSPALARAHMPAFPRLALASAAGFRDARKLRAASCLQLTRAGVFFPWAGPFFPAPVAHGAAEQDGFAGLAMRMLEEDAMGGAGIAGTRLCVIDMSPALGDAEAALGHGEATFGEAEAPLTYAEVARWH